MKNIKGKFLKTIAVSVLLMLVSIVSSYLIILNLVSGRKAIAELKDQKLKYEKRIENSGVLEKKLADLKEDKVVISDSFLDKSEIVKVVEELEYLAEKTGLSANVTMIDMAEGSVDRTPLIVLGLKGSFQNIYHYLYLLEYDRYRMNFNSAYINKQVKEIRQNEKNEWEANLQLKIFSFRKK